MGFFYSKKLSETSVSWKTSLEKSSSSSSFCAWLERKTRKFIGVRERGFQSSKEVRGQEMYGKTVGSTAGIIRTRGIVKNN